MKTIDSIEKYKGKTLKIVFDDGETAFVNSDIVSQYGMKAGINIPESAWQEVIRADMLRKAKERGRYLLDGKDYSYVELVKKLMQTYDEDICFEVADEFAQKGYINDWRYAELIARRLCEVKLYGSYRAKMYMRERGIPLAAIENALQQYEENAAERAADLVEKKYMKYYDPDDRALMQKLKNALVRNGYSYGEIKDALQILEDRLYEE